MSTLAVQLEGRKKPLDTVARETVAQIHGSPSYRTERGQRLNSQQTYLSLWWNDRNWNQEPFILLSYRPLKEKLGLNPDQKHFSFATLAQSDLGNILQTAEQKQSQEKTLTRDEREALNLYDRIDLMMQTVGSQSLPLVPHPSDLKGKWLGLTDGEAYYPTASRLSAQFEQLQQTYLQDPQNLAAVGQQAETLRQQLVDLSPQIYPSDRILQREVFFNHFHPFAKAWWLYAIAFILMLIALNFPQWNLYWSAMGVFSAGLLTQCYGFLLRVQIADRPPVTNMYESVIWVGFGIAALALFFEWRSKAHYYLLAAAPLSVLCLVLADSLPAVLDPSISPLVPVLRDNFWLSIHVPTITLGYASFALAMGLGHVTLGYYLFAPQSQQIQKLSRWNYQVLQVGILLLTAGIILGGIWAHFSWGRFWGWDPKETWALIALLCYLAPLHGRLVGWIGAFGLTVASVISFNAVLMAWYGVNFVLGTGLHSYGFSTGGSALIVAGFVGLDLLFVLSAIVRHQGGLRFTAAVQNYDNHDGGRSPEPGSTGAIAPGR
ncbi:MAG: cytochrome c biogenesis protein CcsA [Cyanobacteria bacterium P01_A01_bin.17]